MRTARASTVSPSILCGGGSAPGGSAPGGSPPRGGGCVCSLGWHLLLGGGGFPPGGSAPGGGLLLEEGDVSAPGGGDGGCRLLLGGEGVSSWGDLLLEGPASVHAGW